MTDTARKTFLAGLRDAYAMERQAKDMMASLAKRLEDYPALRSRAKQHEVETDEQIKRLERCLERLGQSPSTVKNLATRTIGALQSAVHGMVSDEVIKDTLTGFTFEHFEIAAYRQLITMADTLGERDVADALRASLHEEQAMAKWIDEHMDETVREFMQRAKAGVTSRRSAA
jgi:ferritin-like metal-binding protein YciE